MRSLSNPGEGKKSTSFAMRAAAYPVSSTSSRRAAAAGRSPGSMCPGAQLPQISASRVAILADQQNAAIGKNGQHHHRALMGDNVPLVDHASGFANAFVAKSENVPL